MVPNPCACGDAPDQAGRGGAIQRRYGASSEGAGIWNQSSTRGRGEFLTLVPLPGVEALDELAVALRTRLVERARDGTAGGSLDDEVRSLVEREAAPLPEADRAELAARVVLLATGLGPLEPLLADPGVDEVMVNGPGSVYVERRGRLERAPVEFAGDAELLHAIERVLAPLGRRVDEASPLCDARLADGSRVNVVIPPLSLSGPCLTIRRFRREGFSLRDLVAGGDAAGGAGRVPGGVRGGAGVGAGQRRHGLGQDDHAQRPVGRDPGRGAHRHDRGRRRAAAAPARTWCAWRHGRRTWRASGEVTIRQLVRNALRMRPDRIVVGEVRGAEALDMLQALNTGHDGSLTTVHANSPEDALRRVETLALMAGVGPAARRCPRAGGERARPGGPPGAPAPTAHGPWSRSPRSCGSPAEPACASCIAAAASCARRRTAGWRERLASLRRAGPA